jgi:segregation and condensation protein B
MDDLKRIIETALFVATRPLTVKSIQRKLNGPSLNEIEGALTELLKEYKYSDRALEIVPVSGGYQMRTKTDYREYAKLFVREKTIGLTRSMVETLSLVAYKQPIAKAEIDRMRGVDSSRTIKQLLDRGLVEMAGRKEDAGRPLTFQTTRRFLEVFSLNEIGDLPTLREIELLES